jgi:hypothetical protein
MNDKDIATPYSVIVYRDGNAPPTLDNLQETVGGYIEIVSIGDKQMVTNEDGKLAGLNINPEATRWAQREGGIGFDDWIVGTVVVLEGSAKLV